MAIRLAAGWAVAAASAIAAPAADAPGLRLEGATVVAEKQVWTLGPSGLPQQIAIKADASELPLELRGQAGPPPQAALQALGRGDQLRAPVRLVAMLNGQPVAAEPVKPAQPGAGDNRVTVSCDLKAAELPVKLAATYLPRGRVDLSVTYGPGSVDAFSLAVDIAGPVDTVIPGKPLADAPRAYNRAEFHVGTKEGTVWANTGSALPKGGRDLKGVLSEAFVGSGDRGFTWLTDARGFDVDPAVPTMRLERDKAGNVTWLCHFVNRPVKLDKPLTATVSIRVHPARSKPANLRSAGWWAAPPDMPRADRARDRDEAADFVSLEGPAGGDALSAERDLAATYPIALFRYLAGAHTGLGARLKPNVAALVRSGGTPEPDRMAIGRALLHDIGLDAAGLANLAEVAAVAKALDAFGYFKDDGNTEYIPYWRAGGIVRFGEEFGENDAFALTEDNPVADVRVSAWRRPAAGGKGTQALLAVVNESDRPARATLYVLAPGRLFGGGNALQAGAVTKEWDVAAIPAESDWRPELVRNAYGRRDAAGTERAVLKDVMNGGLVIAAPAKGGPEVYGPVFVPPHGFRLLFGTGK